ncbi:MAG TPA: type II CAAX endopeptidase family protein [Polyangiaceae bacterium]|nr:type II CAAX endopeptidase family protein [Polyangiaceae bacterium]
MTAQPSSPYAEQNASRSTAFFFAAAFGISWLLQAPATLVSLGVLAGPIEPYLPFAGLGAFGPFPAALLALRREPASLGARSLFRQLKVPRPQLGNALLALFLPGTILTVSLIASSLVSGHHSAWLYPPRDAQRVFALLLIPLGEELGWRGFAQPRLEAKLGALRASLTLGALWALWHLPVFILAGVSATTLPWMLPFFMAGSVVFTWLYHRGGLLLVVLAHAGAHLNNSHQPLPHDTTPLTAHTIGYALVALTLVLLDRRTFAH